MKEIMLTQGKKTIVDDEDYQHLKKWKWHLGASGYACRSIKKPKPGRVIMHRVINNTPEGFETDHINGDKLDNRRKNLRTVTSQQNKWNSRAHNRSKSGIKGVSWYDKDKRWRVRLSVKGKPTHIGNFKTLPEAVSAYNKAAKKYYGEFARIVGG